MITLLSFSHPQSIFGGTHQEAIQTARWRSNHVTWWNDRFWGFKNLVVGIWWGNNVYISIYICIFYILYYILCITLYIPVNRKMAHEVRTYFITCPRLRGSTVHSQPSIWDACRYGNHLYFSEGGRDCLFSWTLQARVWCIAQGPEVLL